MIKKIRKSKTSKIISSYLALQLIVTTIQPMNMYALTGGPSQPEFNSFTPIGTSDMVNLSSGGFNYNIPIMDVGGYPLNLAYDSGISMDQEASWVGLGWNLNVGQINRQVRGIPDDFKGDSLIYENNLKDNKTVGANAKIHPAVIGLDINPSDGQEEDDLGIALNFGLGVEYNNYTGWSSSASYGVSFQLSEKITVGMNMSNSSSEGVTVSPNVSFAHTKFGDSKFGLGHSLGTTYNSRQGLTALSITPSVNKSFAMVYEEHGLVKSGDVNGSSGLSGTKSFLNTSYTPTKRTSYVNKNYAANGALGFEVFGGEGQGELYIYASEQSVKNTEKLKYEKAYGYQFTDLATRDDILDFNRQNDRIISKNVNTLPVTNQTYDLYSINGQGVSGMFQPRKSQVGYVFDNYVSDDTSDLDLGIEVGGGAFLHVGVEFRSSPSNSSTGLWQSANHARSNFTPSQNNGYDYEPVYYKTIGELNVDHEIDILNNQLGGEEPIRIGLTGNNLNKETRADTYLVGTSEAPSVINFGQKINRTERLLRQQSITNFTKKEVADKNVDYSSDNEIEINEKAKDHHNVETRILQPDGSTYVYGQPVYNTKKQEVTFNVSGNSLSGNDPSKELVNYGGNDNTPNNRKGADHYFNRVTTPAYVHSYLMTQVLSSDYEDLTGDGPSDDDLGAYTKFNYNKHADNYKWRVPFEQNTASSNKGFNSLNRDDMGNYIYGEKELFYIDSIVTKTHIAVFDLNDRNDGYGVIDHNGGRLDALPMQQINTISLYSKPEYLANPTTAVPIKVAHFEYDYSLCKNVPNNNNSSNLDANELSNEYGKLTLKKVYFTYRNSNMGKYTPYQFNYEGLNPEYHHKGYNFWGNYKNPDGAGINPFDEPTTAEFPYVNQSNRLTEDQNAAAWTMTSINLPSGGKIELNYEADDYAFVQNKKTMQMFKVRGVGESNSAPSSFDNRLYDSSSSKKRFLYVELPNEDPNALLSPSEFKSKYLAEIEEDDPIFFKFLLNMVDNTSYEYDYVSGYFKIDRTENTDPSRAISTFVSNNIVYAAVPMQFLHIKSGNVMDTGGENPISKAGWYFGRQYLNRIVYGQDEVENFNILDIAETIVNSIGNSFAVFVGPNAELKQKKCAKRFSPSKSWIRLNSPDNEKIGGGVRVSKILMKDQWDVMTNNTSNPDRYLKEYGQEYSYKTANNISSGVATFEPFGGKENPFIVPFEDQEYKRILGTAEQNYTEKPLGISFFPSAKVTYSSVTVKNLERDPYNNLTLGKNATGRVVNEFYTSKEFPTIAKNTVISEPNAVDYPSTGVSILTSLLHLNIVTKKRLSLSQGFTVITNDMDGKMKSQKVYSESSQNETDFISSVDYIYNVNSDGQLDNNVTTIDEKGDVKTSAIGIDYNVINDFKTAKSQLETYGGDVNLAIVPALVIPIAIASVTPQLAFHDTDLRMATTTKVIHKTGFLKEKRAFDLGAEVVTKNLAWDANSGDVLLTETSNEYNDIYFNFNYPAYWAHDGMRQASHNQGITLNASFLQGTNFYSHPDAKKYLANGDEVMVKISDLAFKAWVVNLNQDPNNDTFNLIQENGTFIPQYGSPQIKVIRSGYRNLQKASMASITLMNNPLEQNPDGTYQALNDQSFVADDWDDHLIVNASSVEYSDTWASQCQCDFPKLTYTSDGELIFNYVDPQNYNASLNTTYNPYVFNIKGDWRAEKSYAYLTGRYNGDDEYNPRNSGFFKQFSPLYKPDGLGNWNLDNQDDRWTFASQVTQYGPYGVELENKDALNRYSSAQYSFNDKLPTAVVSNAQYREIGFDGFEDDSRDDACFIAEFPVGTDIGPIDNSMHFGFFNVNHGDPNSTVGIVEITDEEAHTGNKSVKVTDKDYATLHKIINDPNSCTSYSPFLGETYTFSSWTKQKITPTGSTPQELLDAQPLTYEHPKVQIDFYDIDGTIISMPQPIVFVPSGDIIEGWQKVTGNFTIPANSDISSIHIELNTGDANNPVYYDDVRIHPFNGSMKSFVYDSETYRLMAELDENNYATFYEYDNEGGLIRVKKETEKGIMTIQETRSGNVISSN